MLYASRKHAHDDAGNKISYTAPINHAQRFGCYVNKRIPEAQRWSIFGPWSKPCMMVGYTHDSTTLWKIWDPNFQVVGAQSEVIFDEERNAYISCTTDRINIFGLPEDAEYIEELHTGDGLLGLWDTRDGDGLLPAQNIATGMGGDGLLNGRPKDISGTGEGPRGDNGTRMKSQMCIAICPTTILVEVSLHVQVREHISLGRGKQSFSHPVVIRAHASHRRRDDTLNTAGLSAMIITLPAGKPRPGPRSQVKGHHHRPHVVSQVVKTRPP